LTTAPEVHGAQFLPDPDYGAKNVASYNFCFIKFSPNQVVEAAKVYQTLALTLGVGVWGQIPATNLSPIEEYPHAKFH
jgi:hypothetical protein